jgi:hypothetical protein
MRAKLGYENKIVDITENEVLVFDRKLYTAPLKELIKHYLFRSGVLPPAIRDVSNDVIRLLLRTGELETIIHSMVQYGESLSD